MNFNDGMDEIERLNHVIKDLRSTAHQWYGLYKTTAAERDNLQRKFDHMAVTSAGYTWIDKVNDLLGENNKLRDELATYKEQARLGMKQLADKLGLLIK